MLASINPLGERARRARWGWTAWWYTLGSTIGGLATGAVGGAVGRALHWTVAPTPFVVGIVVLIACAVAVALDLGIGGTSVPSMHRQVNEDWLAHYRGWVYGGGFGLQLGSAVATTVTTAAVYVMVVLAVLSGSVGSGLLIGGVFGACRALPILAVARADDPSRLREVLGRTHAVAGLGRVVAIAALVVVAVSSLVALVV